MGLRANIVIEPEGNIRPVVLLNWWIADLNIRAKRVEFNRPVTLLNAYIRVEQLSYDKTSKTAVADVWVVDQDSKILLARIGTVTFLSDTVPTTEMAYQSLTSPGTMFEGAENVFEEGQD